MQNENLENTSLNDPSAMSNSGVLGDSEVVNVKIEDEFPTDDAKAGGALGAAGGLLTGVVAGSILGPIGAIAGGAIGAVVGGVASTVAVQAVDAIDNDGSVNKDHIVDSVEFTEVTEDPEFNTQTVHRDSANPTTERPPTALTVGETLSDEFQDPRTQL